MNEIILANLLFQVGAAVVLMLVAGISAARQLHARRSVATCSMAPQESGTIVELPAARRIPAPWHLAQRSTPSPSVFRT